MEVLKGIYFQLKVFWKSKILVCLEAIALIGMIVAILTVGIMGGNSYWILSVMVRFSFYCLAFLSVISFVVFSRGLNRDFAETSAAVTGGKFSQRWSSLLAQVIIQAVFLLLLLILLFVISDRNDQNDYFENRIFLNYSWNILFPGLIFILMAWTCSNYFTVRRGCIILIAFLLMTSPLIQGMEWRVKPSIPIDKLIQTIRWPFAILYENSDWSANTQLDFQLEEPRKQVMLFWMIFLLGINIVKSYFEASSISLKRGLSALVLAISAGVLTLSYLPASTYHLNEQWNGSLNADYTYYKDTPYQYEMIKNPDYRVKEMDLSVKMGRQMNVKGKIQLISEQPKKEFVFTLYHGYRVKEFSDTQNSNMEWRQEGDYLYLSYPQEISSGELQIEYKGSCPTYYSYSGGSMLPAYFSWYPMAGEKQIYVFFEDGSYGYNSYNQMEPTKVNLHVDTDMGIVTNLEKTDDGTYTGMTTGVSLFTGLIEPTGNDMVISYLPAAYWKNDPTVDWHLNTIRQSLEETIDFLKNEVEITNIEEVLDKPIIMVSNDICRNGGQNSINIMEDHIITSEYRMSREAIIDSLAKKYGGNFELASQFHFVSNMDLNEIYEERTDFLEEQIEICERVEKNPSDYLPEVVERCKKGKVTYTNDLEKIQYGVSKYGEEEFMKKLLQYTLSDEAEKNDENFMSWLEEKADGVLE